MQQQTESDSQESVHFGAVDPPTQQYSVDAGSENIVPSTEQGTPTANSLHQTPSRINYGPCILCRVNERCILFVGCNHLACCNQCSNLCNNRCPVPDCNRPFQQTLRVFKS